MIRINVNKILNWRFEMQSFKIGDRIFQYVKFSAEFAKRLKGVTESEGHYIIENISDGLYVVTCIGEMSVKNNIITYRSTNFSLTIPKDNMKRFSKLPRLI